MTVSELITELQKCAPSLPVRVVSGDLNHGDEAGDYTVMITPDDATEADSVRYEGSYILVQGK